MRRGSCGIPQTWQLVGHFRAETLNLAHLSVTSAVAALGPDRRCQRHGFVLLALALDDWRLAAHAGVALVVAKINRVLVGGVLMFTRMIS